MTPFFPISKTKVLDDIRVIKQNRNPNNSKLRKVVVIDTETENGNIFLLEDDSGRFLDHPDITFENVAKFLFRYEGMWVFCWNLGYDAICIMKLLPRHILDSYKHNRKLKFRYSGYEINYIPNKQLTIRKGNHSISLYDIAQYYDRKSLITSFEENFNEVLPEEYLKTKDARENFTLSHYKRHKKQIREYCKKDCVLTKRLTEKWLDTFHSAFDFYPRNWVSSGYLAEKVLINNRIFVPRFNEVPYSVQELAWLSFYGGRFELIKRGFVSYCCLYDINSAYPFALTQLPDLTKGKWITQNVIHSKAKVGFFHIIADISNSVKVCPFPFRNKNMTIIYSSGKFETFVTLHELLTVQGDSQIKYKILESYQFIPSKSSSYPFRDFIEKMYAKRLELKKQNDPQQQALKLILNSMYGKTAQTTNNRFGNLFNPVIASFITGFARAQLYKFVRDNNLENQVVAFATDSIAIQKKIPDLNSEKLGEMKLDKEADNVYYLSNGYYRFNEFWKNRGIGTDPNEKNVEIEHKDTIENKDGQLYIEVETTQLQHLKSAIIRNLHKDIGMIRKYRKKVFLNSDRKRLWGKNLERIDDGVMCDSAPINMSVDGEIISEKSEFEWIDDEKYEPESEL
jgi:hypothetical protein